MTMVDNNTVKKFFQFLSAVSGKGATAEIFTCCFLDLESDKPVTGYGTVFGTADEILDVCSEISRKDIDFTLHTTLNQTSLSGRKLKDISAPRVLCLDMDEGMDEHTYHAFIRTNKPHLVVESSPWKFHFYWKVSPTIGLETWSQYQLALAYNFGGDLNLSQLNHTIRVPGVRRICKDGQEYTPLIRMNAWKETTAELALQQLIELFPWKDEAYEAGLKKIEAQKREIRQTLQDVRLGKTGDTKSSPTMGRNSRMYGCVREAVREQPEHVGLTFAILIAQSVNSSFKEPLDERETKLIAEKAWRNGLIARERRLAKIKEAEDKQMEALGQVEEKESTAETDQPLVAKPQVALGTPLVKHTNGKHHPYPYDYSQGELKHNRFTDAALAERVMQRFGKYMVASGPVIYAFDEDNKTWVAQRQTQPMLARYVAECVQDTLLDPNLIKELCLTKTGDFSKEKYKQFETKMKSNYMLSGTIGRLKNWLWKSDSEEFDRDPYKLYVANGVIDLEKGRLGEPTAEDRLLRQSSAVAVPGAKCDGWLKFLSEVFGENEESEAMITFLQEVFGYSLTGSIEEQKIFIHYGGGCNGKSKVLEALALIMGDYATRIGSNALAKTKNAIVKELERLGAKIEGKRVVILDDLDSGTQWNEGLVKLLTGPRITARRLYEEERDIPNRAKFHIGCNAQPEPETENYGLVRRLCIIPYERQFEPSAVKEQEIMNMLAAETSGILNWAIKGLNRLIKEGRGIQNTNEVKVQAEYYAEEHFSLEQQVRKAFRAPRDKENGEDIALPRLVEEIEKTLPRKAMGRKIGNDDVGRILKRLGCKMERTRIGGHKTRVYTVVRIDNSLEQL